MNVTLEKITFRQNQPYSIRVQQIVRTPIHWHEGVTEILVPLRGRVRVTAAFEQLTVQEGEFYFINNQALHSIQSDSGAVAALIQVNLPYFADQFKYLSYMFFRSTPLKDSLSSYSSSFKDIGPEEKARFLDLLVDIIKLEIFKGPEHVDLYLQD